jgi:hypothetical protein
MKRVVMRRPDRMVRPRTSITGLMAAIVIAACGFAVLRRDLVDGPPYRHDHTSIVGVLPMACLLTWAAVVGLITLFRRGECPAFLVGFEVFGWVAVLLFAAYRMVFHWSPLILFDPLLRRWDGRVTIPYRDPSVLLFHIVIFLVPQLAVSLLGGLLAHALGIRLVRDGRSGKPG